MGGGLQVRYSPRQRSCYLGEHYRYDATFWQEQQPEASERDFRGGTEVFIRTSPGRSPAPRFQRHVDPAWEGQDRADRGVLLRTIVPTRFPRAIRGSRRFPPLVR